MQVNEPVTKGETVNFTKSQELFQEALELLPGGVKGIRHPDFYVPGAYPIFLKGGKGGRITDVDGNEYIDWLCSYGPNIIGHGHPRICEMVLREAEKGFCLTLCQPVQNRLAQKLKELIPCAERVIFVTTGSESTTSAVRIARIHTERELVLRCGYQGFHDWCVPYTAGVPKSAQDFAIQFDFGDLDQFEELIKRHGENIACVIMTPIGHDARRPLIIPSKEYLAAIRKITADFGIVLIFDEIRTGFRLALGGAQEYFNVVPDMATFSKAISNGFPLAAIAMKKELDASARKAYISATYFPNSTPMEAALITLDEIEKNKLIDHVWKIGETVQKGMQELSGKFDIPLTVSGLGPIFYMHFDEDFKDNTVQLGETTRTFYTEMINRGVFLNPIHNWFVCGAHTEEDAAQTLQAMEDALKIVKDER